jgi:hypothetical protein
MPRRLVPLAAALALLVGACGAPKPFSPPVADDIRPGPGLFTGETGELVIRPPKR